MDSVDNVISNADDTVQDRENREDDRDKLWAIVNKKIIIILWCAYAKITLI